MPSLAAVWFVIRPFDLDPGTMMSIGLAFVSVMSYFGFTSWTAYREMKAAGDIASTGRAFVDTGFLYGVGNKAVRYVGWSWQGMHEASFPTDRIGSVDMVLEDGRARIVVRNERNLPVMAVADADPTDAEALVRAIGKPILYR